MDQERTYQEMEVYLGGLDDDALAEKTKSNIDQERRDYEAFRSALAEDSCSLCGNPLAHFSVKKPCLHWLLKPKGFRKKQFRLLYSTTNFHDMDAYLRWAANAERPFQNINDLVDEKTSEKFIEHTITFRNLEWAFSCSHVLMAIERGMRARKPDHVLISISRCESMTTSS